jgi:hypothetical protein
MKVKHSIAIVLLVFGAVAHNHLLLVKDNFTAAIVLGCYAGFVILMRDL